MTLIPIQVTFRGLQHSDALEEVIRERVEWLEQFYAGIIGCRVVVELPHRHRRGGRHFHVRIEMTVPGGTPIVINQEPSLHGPLKDVEEAAHTKDTDIDAVHRHAQVAIRDAFDAAKRRVQDFARQQRHATKTHAEPTAGHVASLSKAEGFGVIESGERQIYFARASVLEDAFDDLDVGTKVTFVEEKGDKGPQASTVRVVGKHQYVES